MQSLSFISAPVAVAILLVITYIVHTLVAYARLRQFSGPPLSGFTGLVLSRAIYKADCHEWLYKISNNYGTVARIAPNVLLTSSPELWAYVNRHKRYTKSAWFYHTTRFMHQRDSIFSLTNNEKHDELRRQLAPGYTGRDNRELEGAIDDCVSQLLSLIRSKYISSEGRIVPLDVSPKIHYFALDVISTVAYGKAFGMLNSDTDVNGYIKSAIEGLRAINVAWALNLHRLLHEPYIGKLFAPSPADKRGFGRMMGSAFAMVDERESNKDDERADMLASFMKNGLNGDELRAEVMGQIVAGSDTTATSIKGIIMNVISNSRVYAKLQSEIKGANVPHGTIIPYAQAKSLPYFQVVIREGLRTWIPASQFFPREVPPEGDYVPIGDGKNVFLPGGTIIGPSTVAMQRDEQIWGDDAGVFRPERWFEADQLRLERMRQTNDLIFSTGRFRCLGKPVAWMEMSKAIFELFRNFDIATNNPTRFWKSRTYLGLSNITDMWVHVMEREHD